METHDTWSLEWRSLAFRRRVPRRAQAALSRTHHSERVSARLAFLEPDSSDITVACKECSRAVGKATRADRIVQFLQHAPRVVWEVCCRTRRTLQSTATLTQTLLDAQDTSRNLWEMLACWRTHTLVTRSSTEKVVSLSSGEPEHCSM